jgi:cytidylate kinase
MSSRVITIGREFGSGGRTVGRMLAQRRGIPCYDREIIEEIAEKSGFAKSYIEEKGEYGQPSLLGGLFTNRMYYQGQSNEDIIWLYQRELILDLAQRESCVIVGRCADYILREREDVLRVFIHADLDYRARRIVEVYGQREAAPEQRLREKDRRRAAYYQFYTDMDWGDARNYHISLDTSALGIEKCVELLSDL